MERIEGRKENDSMKKWFRVFKSNKRKVSLGFQRVNEARGR